VIDDLSRRLGRCPTGDGPYGDSRSFRLETSVRAATAQPPAGLDDHVTDVAGIARLAVEQPAVDDDAAADTG
jgi:hypothetical protein